MPVSKFSDDCRSCDHLNMLKHIVGGDSNVRTKLYHERTLEETACMASRRAIAGSQFLSLAAALVLVASLVGYLSLPQRGATVTFESATSSTGPTRQSTSSFTGTTTLSGPTTSVSTTASTVSLPVITTVTFNTGGLPYGCDTPAGSTITQGLNLTVYTSGSSPKIGSIFCVIASLVVIPGSTLSMTSASVISFTLTGPDDKSSTLNSCYPSGIVNISPTPFRKFACSAYWDTRAPINGVSPPPGIYIVTITGSLDYNDKTLPRVSSVFDVTLMNG